MEAISLTSIIKPLYYLCKVFGLASFCLCNNCGKKRYTFLHSGAWLSLSWALIYAVNSCLVINFIVQDSDIPDNIAIASVLYYLSLHFTSIIYLCLCNIFRRRNLPLIIDKIEELCNIFTMKVDTNLVYKRMKWFVIFETTVLLLINGTVNAIYLYSEYDSSILETFWLIVEVIGSLCNSLIIIQFVSIVMLLKYILKCINHELGYCYDVLKDSCRYSIIRIQPGGLKTFRSPGTKLISSLCNKVHGLRITYSRLSAVISLVNSYYGFTILMLVSWLFITIVTVLYDALLLFFDSEHTDNLIEYYYDVFDALSLCIYSVILMAVITTSCHLISDETEDTIFHIQNLLLCRDIGKETEKELTIFCSQVKYSKLELTACDLFKLNLPFMKSFISACFAYFVIVFQLK
ncbi:hypothetical protein L798_14333 [Zootermopsis nevadensis]|uniref:Gustatory receptor n=1 Tax=Zootermopsis nevadensis TaxID=136037 RepID=A0A067QZT4_ZOONE|nr:hypothetical protein L798_14333 [Zootermopsis nevadensis]